MIAASLVAASANSLAALAAESGNRLSLLDAIRASIAMDRVQIKAAALILANFETTGMELLERQMMIYDAQLHRAITNELNADRAAVDAALRQLPADG